MKYFPRSKILYVNRKYGFSSSTHANLISTLLSQEIIISSKYFLNNFIDSGLELGHPQEEYLVAARVCASTTVIFSNHAPKHAL